MNNRSPAVKPGERWNDYGIGLLREGNSGSSKGELRQAEQAFQQVEALGENSGALNLARVLLQGRTAGTGRNGTAASQRTTGTAVDNRLVQRADRPRERPPGGRDRTLESIINNQFAAARQRGFDFSYDVRVLNELGRTLYERSRQLHGAAQHELLIQALGWFDRTLANRSGKPCRALQPRPGACAARQYRQGQDSIGHCMKNTVRMITPLNRRSPDTAATILPPIMPPPPLPSTTWAAG